MASNEIGTVCINICFIIVIGVSILSIDGVIDQVNNDLLVLVN